MSTESRASPVQGERTLQALVLAGGWEGHTPELNAAFAEHEVLRGFAVTQARDLCVLDDATLAGFDLLVPIWTFGELSTDQEHALLRAVERGMGLLAWHGFASAFLGCRAHKFLLGGQFVSHPGGDGVRYTVRFDRADPLTHDLQDVTITSEQYYLLVDPAVRVLASTEMAGAEMPWTAGVPMPQAWTRTWGAGRVAYCAPGHTLGDLRQPSIVTFLRRAATWAARRPQVHETGTPSITLNVGPAGVMRAAARPAS